MFSLDPYDPYYYAKIGACALAGIVVYWLIWKKNARLANWIVFGATIALIAYLTNWDYILNHWFRVTEWSFPGSR